ncbi:F0F1 ATP synthase subunit delta [Naumannella halotolerans]|uniref:ATP synthase subunit delta n=1 Tax=Naumannella halotolerans TaxID=993414 RepID=A0A4R7JAP9_9ACTN|nr:F0F1 ATP synthase subunit delta [Naumannella halotolerans]TDT33643.1 F-type H+-transporting ATPase subunit delta [Naumannella halotolerans]
MTEQPELDLETSTGGGDLDQVVDSVLGSGDPAVISSELFSVVDALDASPALRRALTDPGLPPRARRGVAERLLAGQLTDATITVVGSVAEKRWSAISTFVAELERLGVRARLIGAEREGRLDRVEDELFRFERVVDADSELRNVLADRTAPVERRTELVADLLRGKADPATIALAERAVRARERTFTRTMEHYLNQTAALRNRSIATVRVARPLDAEQEARLRAALTKQAGRAISLQVIVDPTVLGGVRVEVGDQVIEGSVASRLEAARRTIR